MIAYFIDCIEVRVEQRYACNGIVIVVGVAPLRRTAVYTCTGKCLHSASAPSLYDHFEYIFYVTKTYSNLIYTPPFRHNGVTAGYRNDLRQVAVNKVAEYVGASSGKARYYGVPGAGRYVYDNRNGYGSGYGGYGGYGAGYGGYGAGYAGGYGAGYDGGYGAGYDGGYAGGYY